MVVKCTGLEATGQAVLCLATLLNKALAKKKTKAIRVQCNNAKRQFKEGVHERSLSQTKG